MTTLDELRRTFGRLNAAIDRGLDRQFAFLCRQPPVRLAGILLIGLIVPWLMMATIPVRGGPSVGPVVDVSGMACVVAVLALVVPRLRRGRERLVLVGYFAFLVNFIVAEFAYLYFQLGADDRFAFSEPLGRFDAAYLAVGTFTTVGSGIDANSTVARVASMSQTVLGFGTVAIAIAMVVGSYPGSTDGE